MLLRVSDITKFNTASLLQPRTDGRSGGQRTEDLPPHSPITRVMRWHLTARSKGGNIYGNDQPGWKGSEVDLTHRKQSMAPPGPKQAGGQRKRCLTPTIMRQEWKDRRLRMVALIIKKKKIMIASSIPQPFKVLRSRSHWLKKDSK